MNVPAPSVVRLQRGFTLIEVILALTIFALMGAILFGAFSLGHRAIERSQVHFEKNQKMRSLDDLIAGYVRSSYPYRPSAQDAAVYFRGEAEAVSFVSSYSLTMGGRGMALIRLAWIRGDAGEGAVIVEEEVPVRVNEEERSAELGERSSIVVEERVRRFQLAYLDPREIDEQWEERWDAAEKQGLPRAVRMTYSAPGGREVRRVFPIMVNVLGQ
jgi:prepilin-type N-terminal cleavage/methylation domain-containing protein